MSVGNWLFVVTSVAMLSACGGGGGSSIPGGGGLPTPGVPVPSAGNYPQVGDFIAAQNAHGSATGSGGATNPANFPNSASYNGVASLQRFGGMYFGVLNMNVDFAQGDFSGSMNQFNELDFTTTNTTAVDVAGGFSMNGTLTGNNGFSNALNGTASGTLDGLSDNMSITGNFAGTNADSVELLFLGGVFQGLGYAN